MLFYLYIIIIIFYDYFLNVSFKKFSRFKKLELAYILHKYIST